MPCAAITAIEVNPRVAELARSHFLLPDDDKRLRVVLADGASWVAQHCASADVIMVDAYDGDAHVERLCSEDFYLDCVRALEADGVLVANVWANDRRFARILARIATAFPAGNACLPAKKPGNVIVIGFQSSPGELRWRDLKLRARLLEQRYGLEFVDFVDALRKMNPHDHKCLRL
jgi:spermidine synthase